VNTLVLSWSSRLCFWSCSEKWTALACWISGDGAAAALAVVLRVPPEVAKEALREWDWMASGGQGP